MNLLAAPGELCRQGRTVPVGNPTLVAAETVLEQFPIPSRFLTWLDGTDEFVRIEDLSRVPPPDAG